MGFNSTVVVLNDAIGYIEKDPGFGKNLCKAIAQATNGKQVDVVAGPHCNAATVVETHHATHYEVTAVGGNCGIRLGWTHYHNGDKVAMLKDLAWAMGYRLIKRKGTL